MTDRNLVKVTVNLNPEAWAALHNAAQALEMTRTDVINRALQIYNFLISEEIAGNKIQVYDEEHNKRFDITGLVE